jgi:uncharacterized protein (DUF305 family)
MTRILVFRQARTFTLLTGLLLVTIPILGMSQAPIVQPGAPGEPARMLDAEEAVEIANTAYSPDDVKFMQDMIPHHHQAMEMAALVDGRTNHPEITDVAGRINASQSDEIAFMQQWLADRNEQVPEPTAHDAMHTSHKMAGMATPEQMSTLAQANGTDFDRLFLELMIRHHDGAITMVKELLQQSGAAYDPILFEFTSDITNDQAVEIERMNGLLVGLSDDPRASLSAGLLDAGIAISNLELVTSLLKPPGFFDPKNPADRSSKPVEKEASENESEDEDEEVKDKLKDNSEGRRDAMMSFSYTDMAFRDDLLVAGSYHGFNIFQLQANGVPLHMASVVCPGGQGDVSIVGDLLIMSAQETRGRLDCGLEGVREDVSADRFRGIRIFDISDPKQPLLVGAVQTCRGSHTHSVVSGPGEDGKIIVYNSGTSSVREEEEMPGCFDELPGDDRTALFRIDVIEIPVDDPSKSRIVNSPAVFADPETGVLAGLWRGGDHGDLTQETSETDQCHDITVFPESQIAAGACSGNGILFDISDPLNPQRMDVVEDQGFAYWHSATFNNDGSKVLFTDEWGGGGRPRCRAWDPLTWGANAIYDIIDSKLVFRSYFKLPAPQLETENCVAHNGSIIPVPGRDLFIQSWYQGGVSLMDFSDSGEPIEIAYFDRGPIDAEELVFGGFWSSYWYKGYIYGTETIRGLDVFKLLPSEYLSENEIAAANLADQGSVFNPQQQFPVTWPAHPVVARAYLDQLQRSDALPVDLATRVSLALDKATIKLDANKRDRVLVKTLDSLVDSLRKTPAKGNAALRINKLTATLEGLGSRLGG